MFLKSRSVMGRPVKAEHVVVLAGAGAVLETVFYCIAGPGDGVLIPTPSYAGFWADLQTRNQVRIVPVDGHHHDGFALSIAQYQQAFATADCDVRAVLVTSPSNPLENGAGSNPPDGVSTGLSRAASLK